MTPLEIAAVIFSVAYVILAALGNVWCWPIGIIASALYIIFSLSLNYYQDAILQGYYVLAGFYGWYVWAQKKGSREQLSFHSSSVNQLLPYIVLGLVLFPITGYIFSKWGNAYSYVDAFTTVFSFIATWMTARKILQNWLFWIVIDAILVYQFGLKHSYLTSGLYLFYTFMSVWGYYKWRKLIFAA